MSPSHYLFTDVAFDPREPRRHRAEAGVAFEKHRWTVPARGGGDWSVYEHPVREEDGSGAEAYEVRAQHGDGRWLPGHGVPIIAMLAAGALPAPPFNVHVLLDGRVANRAGGSPEVVARSIAAAHLAQAGRVWLCVTNATLRTGLPVGDEVRQRMLTLPSREAIALYRKTRSFRVAGLLASVPGLAWEGAAPEEEDAFGVALLTGEEALGAVLRGIGEERYHSAYLVVDPEPLLEQELRAPSSAAHEMLRGLAGSLTPRVSYLGFHRLVSRCAYVVTSHGLVDGWSPYCLYSAHDQRPALRQIASTLGLPLRETERLEDLPGHEVDAAARGDVIAVLGPEAVRGVTALSLKDPHVTRLDGLAAETGLRELWLDGLGFLDFQSLGRLHGLERLVLDVIPGPDLAALSGLRKLRSLGIQCEPRGGWRQLQHLPWLEELQVFMSVSVDTGAIAQLPALRELLLSSILEPVDLAPLRALTALRELTLCELANADGHALSALTGLRSLRVGAMPISDLSWLPALVALERLALSDLAAGDYTPVLGLPSLRTLYVPQGRVPVHLLDELRARGVEVKDVARWT